MYGKIIKTIVTIVLIIYCFSSCEKTPVQPAQPAQPSIPESELFHNRIKGVWVMNDNNEKGLFFVSFQPTSATQGNYALCVSTSIMSSGTYKLTSTGLQLTNYSGNNCGNLSVSFLDNYTCLRLKGNIISYDTQHNETFYEDFTLTNETISNPIVGSTYIYHGTQITYGSFTEYVILNNNYVLRDYCQQDGGTHTIFQDHFYYYVYRQRNNPEPEKLVYTQGFYSMGYVHIYQLIDWTLQHFKQTEIMPY